MTIPFLQSTRARLLLLILLVILPAFVVQGYGAWSDLQHEIAARKQSAGQIVVRAQGKFETLLDTSRSVFTNLVRLNAMRNPDNCTLLFNDLRLAYERLAPDAVNFGLSDAQGNIYCAVNPITGNVNLSNQTYFQRAVKSLDMAVGDYTPRPASLPFIGVAYPVLSFDGKIQTVIFIQYELSWLETWQREVALPAGTMLTLVSPDGEILQGYLNGMPIASGGNAQQAAWYAPLLAGQDLVEAPDLDGVVRLHALIPLKFASQTAAWLHLGYPVAEIYTQAQQALAWRLTLLVIIFVVALGLAWWGSETLFLHPLNSLMNVVEKVQHGDLGARAASIPAVGELTGLAQAFDRMAESLQQRELSQKQAQTELRESETRFRAMFENTTVGMGLLGLDRRIIDANPAMSIMLGLTHDELLGETPTIVTHPDDLAESTRLHQELFAGKIDHYNTERRYLRKDGQAFWASVSMSMVHAPDGTPLYLVGLINDIDQQKRTVESLRESEARFRAMFDNISIGMALVSFDRQSLAVNQTIAQITGYSGEELSQINIADLTYPEDSQIGATEFREMVTGQRESMQMERRYLRKNGEIFWARICYSLVRNQNNEPEYLVGSMEDITDRRLAADKLAEQEAEYRRTLEQRVEERTHELADANLWLLDEIEQRKRVEEALAAKAAEDAVTAERTRLARDLHDAVTQTLFAASLIAEVLPDLWAIDVDEARKSTDELRQLTRGALAEMRTLLLELRPAALTQSKLGDLLRQLCEALIGRSRLPINLVVEGDRPIPPEVQVAFYRIAQESLNNVFKYARATKVDVELFMSPAGGHFSVCDNGVGFDISTKKSTSLGLRIMRERAEAVGATFSVSSNPGQGTCVEVEWIEKPDMKLSVFKK